MLQQPERDRPRVLEGPVEPRGLEGSGYAAGRVKLGSADHAGQPAVIRGLCSDPDVGRVGAGAIETKGLDSLGPASGDRDTDKAGGRRHVGRNCLSHNLHAESSQRAEKRGPK